MTETREPVLLVTAKSPFEAKVICGVLAGAGVQTYGDTGMLMDEWAASQRAMNLLGVKVLVAPDQLELARKALAEADEASALLDDESFDPGTEEKTE